MLAWVDLAAFISPETTSPRKCPFRI